MSDEPKPSVLIGELRSRGHLPALDANVATISSLAGDPLTCTAELTSVILRDCALTASVISTANSAFYHPAEPVKTVSTAILMMGFEKVQTLALGLGILQQVGEKAQNRNLHRLFACSYFAGMFAMALGRKLGHENPEELLVAGVLSQLPRLLLAHAFPDRYAAMENRMANEKLPLERACQEVFGINYYGLAEEIAQFWNMPASVARFLRGDARSDTVGRALREAGRVADMIFGNLPGGGVAMAATERELQTLLKNSDFKLNEFIGQTCDDDPNVGRFFQLTPQDVEMMVKIVEWGKVNPAEVAASLTFGERGENPLRGINEDPNLLIGQYLAELMVSTRKGADINRILLTGLEAIYRCVRPACALLAFRDVSKQHLQGRFYLGPSPTVHACDFLVSLQDDQSPITKCLKTQQPLRVSVPRDLPGSFFSRLKLDAVLLVPIIVLGNAIGQCVVGRDNPPAFSQQEEMWVEAVAGHLAMAFERTRAVASL